MRRIVSNTSPLNYLVLQDRAAILPRLYGSIVIPTVVLAELQHASTPAVARTWIANPPTWLTVEEAGTRIDPTLFHLDAGEQAAITLTEQTRADLVILDDRAARDEAERRGLTITGTLGVLETAAPGLAGTRPGNRSPH